MKIVLNPETKRITIECSFVQFLLLSFAFDVIPRKRTRTSLASKELDDMEQPMKDCTDELFKNHRDDILPSKVLGL